MTLNEIKEYLSSYDGEIILLENPSYETAIIGIDSSDRIIYDYDKMAEYLVDTDNMTIEEAYEFIDYNTIRALPYMGDKAPIIKMDLPI